MKQCNNPGCISYAVNIERDIPENHCLCDVCHWTKRYMDTNQHLGNLLAIIHRDGGHYISKHGVDKAVKDAEAILGRLMRLEDDV